MRDDTGRAREALQFIPADLAREDWVRAGMAAHAAGLTLDDFDAWSAQGANYDARAARDTWRSFKQGKGVSAGTLFRMAGELGGWKDGDTHAKRSASKATTRPQAAPKRPRPGMGASAVWNSCVPATDAHSYIISKQGNAQGLRVVPASDPLRVAGASVAGWLVVPVVPLAGGEPVSLQFIPPPGAGMKLNLPGAPVAGVFAVGDLSASDTVFLCEGIGQAWACWKATGAAALVCFGWGRVRSVAAELRQRETSARLVLVPDVGKEAEAETIAREVAALFVTMPQGWPKNADVNDLAQRAGFDALEVLLQTARGPLSDGVVLLNGADLVPQPVSWLWRNWLALGKLHILAGAPGQGKTTIAMSMAATVTSGGRWPDGSRCERGHALIWSGEDDPADTLLPRLIAAGADKTRVHFVSGTRTDGEMQPFDPATGMAQLAEQAARIGHVRLIVVDPVVSAVTGDSHKNTEVRRALQPLVNLASTMGAALVGISHFSKGGQGQDPASRVVGSIAFTAVARVVLVAAKVKGEDGQDRRILARGKSNIGPDDGGFEYTIDQTEALPGIQAARIEWGASVDGSARELLTDPAEESEEGNALDSAATFLRDVLGDGLMPVKSIETEAKGAGIAWRTIRRASDSLGVVKRRGMESRWYWSLPKLSKHGNLSNLSNVQTLDKLDNMAASIPAEVKP